MALNIRTWPIFCRFCDTNLGVLCVMGSFWTDLDVRRVEGQKYKKRSITSTPNLFGSFDVRTHRSGIQERFVWHLTSELGQYFVVFVTRAWNFVCNCAVLGPI